MPRCGGAASPAEAATVTAGPLQHSLVFSARVASVARSDIASTLTARVERVLVREGDTVKAGQLLIELDDNDLRAQAQQAQAALATAGRGSNRNSTSPRRWPRRRSHRASANLDFALSELERNRALHGKGFIGDARLQDAERAAASARAAYQQATAQASANSRAAAEATASETRRFRRGAGALRIARAKLSKLASSRPPTAASSFAAWSRATSRARQKAAHARHQRRNAPDRPDRREEPEHAA